MPGAEVPLVEADGVPTMEDLHAGAEIGLGRLNQ
jgi:hypothetical protein